MEVEVLPDVQLPIERVLLGDDPADLLHQRRMCSHVDAGDEPSAGRGHHPGGEYAGGRGLASAVGTEEAEDLAGGDIEVEAVDGRKSIPG